MQRRITKNMKLLDEQGKLQQRGYATSLVLEYNKEAIKASKWRVKEWDYYLISNDDYGIALTLADNSYIGLISISLIDFKRPSYKTVSKMIPFTFGKLELPNTSLKGDVQYEDEEVTIRFLNDGEQRRIQCKMKVFDKGRPFECDMIVKEEPKDSMVIATPFKEDPKSFYYNQKIVGMKAQGYAKYGDKLYRFKKDTTRGILDWGRGVWPYKSTWYWGVAAGILDGKELGWNIGYGFGDTSAATENMVFYEGKAHKLEEVTFHIPRLENGKYDYMRPWVFTSNNKRFEMDFVPIIDRRDLMHLGILASNQHQTFGRYSGTIILSTGEKLQVKDMLGSAEHIRNRW